MNSLLGWCGFAIFCFALSKFGIFAPSMVQNDQKRQFLDKNRYKNSIFTPLQLDFSFKTDQTGR